MYVKPFSLLFLLGLLILPFRSVSAQELPRYHIDPQRVTVSGISSGGYMAVQVDVAFSGSVHGVGVVAGGPFQCARSGALDYTTTAVTVCTGIMGHSGDPDLDKVMELTRDAGERKVIDDPSNLCGQPVYLYSGTADTVVPQGVMSVLKGFYEKTAGCGKRADIAYVSDQPVVHAYVVDDPKLISCADLAKLPAEKRAPYICNGDYDTAGAILKHLYGKLKAKTAPVAAHLKTFSQKPFIMHPYSATQDAMHESGHVYVPAACEKGAVCGLHVAIHGCHQNQDESKDAFYTQTGYNGWAEANNIIVLYPQAKAVGSIMDPINPEGCWDFWGYNRVDFYQRGGPQLSAIAKMINQLSKQPLIPDMAAEPKKGR